MPNPKFYFGLKCALVGNDLMVLKKNLEFTTPFIPFYVALFGFLTLEKRKVSHKLGNGVVIYVFLMSKLALGGDHVPITYILWEFILWPSFNRAWI